MKKLVYMFLLVGSLLIGANVANAADYGNKKNKAKMYVSCSEQTAQLKALIGNPNLVLDQSYIVKVTFSINENNVVTINDIKTDNAELKRLVFQKLNGKQIEGNNVEINNQSLTIAFENQDDKSNVFYGM